MTPALAVLDSSTMGLAETNCDINPVIIQALQISGVSYDAKAEVMNLYDLVCEATYTASKGHFYDGLDEWSKSIYEFIRERMTRFGFVNGERTQAPDARYWLQVYELFTHITLSRHLKTDVVRHHASAFERNEAFKAELRDWIVRINERPNLVRMVWPGWNE